MKKLLLLSLIVPLSFSLSACGKSDAEKKEACMAKFNLPPEKVSQEEYKNLMSDPICQSITGAEVNTYNMEHPQKQKINTSDKQIYAHPNDNYFNEYKPKEHKEF